MNFTDIFTTDAIAARWTEAATNRDPYLGEVLFPADKKLGLDLSFLKGSKGLPVALMPSAFDAMPTFRDRGGFEITETNMPFYREGFKIKEKDRQEILKVQESNSKFARPVIAKIFNDADELLEGAMVAAEVERMGLLFPQNGHARITVAANGVKYDYNYDPDGSWRSNNYFELTGTAKWDNPSTANPFADVDNVKTAIRGRTGNTPAIAVMNSTTFNYFAAMTVVSNRYIARAGVSMSYLTKAEIKRVLEDTAEIRILIYDKMYKDQNKVAHKFVPDGYVAMIPEGALGNSWYGTTPEEADLMANGNAEVSIVNKGIAITREVTTMPVNVNIYASQIVLPSYEGMDDVALLKVV